MHTCVLCADSMLFCKMDIYKIIREILHCVYHYFAAKDIDIGSFVVRNIIRRFSAIRARLAMGLSILKVDSNLFV